MKDCLVLLLVIIAAVGVAQTPATFDVISVKPYITQSDPSQESSDSRVSPGGRFTGRNVSAMKLLRMAFVVEDSRISGVPGWCSSQSYDIEAKTAGGVGRRGNTVAFGHGYRPAGLTPTRRGDYEEPGPRYSAPSNGVPRRSARTSGLFITKSPYPYPNSPFRHAASSASCAATAASFTRHADRSRFPTGLLIPRTSPTPTPYNAAT